MTSANEYVNTTLGRRVRWAVVVGLALVAAGLLVHLGRAIAGPDDLTPPATPSVLAVTGQITRDSYGVFLVDLDKKTLCVYEFVKAQRKLRLLAARTYAFDALLDDYNTEPSPREIRDLVKKHPRLTDPQPPVVEPTTQPGGVGETP